MKLFHSFILRKCGIMKKIIIFLFICCLTCGCGNSSVDNEKQVVSTIATDSVFTMVDREDVYIIDVREEYEYVNGHIKNAYNIPLSKINSVSQSTIPLDSVVIVYCQSGNRSKMAAQLLLDLGYQEIYDMGGVNSWNYELIKE